MMQCLFCRVERDANPTRTFFQYDDEVGQCACSCEKKGRPFLEHDDACEVKQCARRMLEQKLRTP